MLGIDKSTLITREAADGRVLVGTSWVPGQRGCITRLLDGCQVHSDRSWDAPYPSGLSAGATRHALRNQSGWDTYLVGDAGVYRVREGSADARYPGPISHFVVDGALSAARVSEAVTAQLIEHINAGGSLADVPVRERDGRIAVITAGRDRRIAWADVAPARRWLAGVER